MFTSLKTYQLLFLRLIIILSGTGISIFLFQKGLVFTAVFGLLIIFLLVVEMYFYVKNAFLIYDRTITSILQNDFTSDFSKHKSYQNYSNLFKLYETLKNKENEQVSKDIIYRSILNNIETGIIILQKEGNDWNIFLMNDYFSKHFDVPKVTKWNYLKSHLPSLCEIIEEQSFQEIKTSLEIRVNQQDTQTFVMQTSRSEIYNRDYCIVLLESIQNVIEKKEKEAWVNLMKVISHELLNSITPIRSLSQNLQDLVQQEIISAEDLDDMKSSVATMLRRSDHLQQFVESYRKLAMLPSPKKEKTELLKMIENGFQIMAPIFKKEQIEVINTIPFDRWLNIDPQQIEQVLINLFTNCIYALKDTEKKQIVISAEVKEKRTFIMITDNGKGIEKEIESKIFLPFFTTRNEGAGIGLTLSKSIVEAHGGYLAYRNDNEKTTFLICLVDK
ncbi:sensor histidine kinase [Flavobacterium gawalongense]|uniref:histidine kinase n=1 Tax=Flavobacterium gawalongense TaxID=2594432 RepID=A0A553BEP6_9FLAO|nr:HAMP domain-containing sensor histidine kinase [Flavobacterium gawalongense]TRW99087.1 HAMP domain-containing histidine kinase [Flavobacterium gawalongense]TRX03791.1 HAMP domain-containing histidine kinase [Flavobacterium gawalongense]TRX06728.1 HAMP domain-containing histidine kinase [Flavobacterium gawalongense]TRX07575.1 HAMP domain-containing histidine kinase [Flavobacterium gawalongense]TRX23404.1 HAMP domain-containing histidine kinase [Flavobacterium gawalongense]